MFRKALVALAAFLLMGAAPFEPPADNKQLAHDVFKQIIEMRSVRRGPGASPPTCRPPSPGHCGRPGAYAIGTLPAPAGPARTRSSAG